MKWPHKSAIARPHPFNFGFREENVVKLTCLNSSFSLNRLVDVDAGVWRDVSWEWKAEELPVGADIDPAGKADKVLQILFAFDALNVVSYVCDTTAPIGTVTGDTSFPFAVKELVIESGPANLPLWARVKRNLFEDYTALFGQDPRQLKAVRIQTNSQYTRSHCAGSVTKLTFEKGPE